MTKQYVLNDENSKINIKKYFNIRIFLFIVFNILYYTNSALEAHILSPENNIIKVLLLATIILLLYTIHRFYSIIYTIMTIICFGMGLILIVKILSFIAIFYISYTLTLKQGKSILKVLTFILFLNAIFIFIEINGLIPELAFYQIYDNPMGYNDALFVVDSYFPLFQLRPHGLYHSTIYLSFEMIFIFAVLMYPVKNFFTLFLLTFIAVFSGSTALFLIMIILIIMTSRVNGIKIVLQSLFLIIFWLLLYYNLYPSFFTYNFNYISYLTSFTTRLDVNSTHSTFTANFNIFILIIVLLLLSTSLYLIKNKFIINLRYVYVITIIMIIMLIHNFILTTKLYMNIGLIIGFVSSYYNVNIRKKINE